MVARLTLDVPATRAALTRLSVPVLLYGSELDPMVRPSLRGQAAPLLHDATLVIEPAAAHVRWVDEPAAFSAAIGSFLG